MSLAYFAASIDDNSTMTNYNNSDNILNQKRHKKTQKKYPKIENFDNNKVNSVLEKIHNNTDDDDDDDANLHKFNPPPKPVSMGAERTIPKTENFSDMKQTVVKTVGRAPMPNYENTDNLDLNNYTNYGDDKSNEEYYKKILPGYSRQINQPNLSNRPYYHNNSYANNISPNYENEQDVLLKKINYMISLLEDQQDEKTNNVTEEVILYSFLGIFMIFLADTFVKAGKYTR